MKRTRHFIGIAFPLLTSIALLAAAPAVIGCGGDPVVEDDSNVTEDATTGDDLVEGDAGGDGDEGAADARSDIEYPVDGVNDTDGTATADDGTEEDTTVVSVECQEPPSTPVIKVNVYNDANSSSKTDFAQSRTAVDTPIPGIPVSLVAPASGSGETCDEGWYYFGPDAPDQFTDGVRVLKIDTPDCRVTSHNMARRTPIALTDGRLKVLVMGDSIPKQGTTPGTFFFDNLAADLAGFGDIEVVNVAQSGSTTIGWMPELNTGLFKVRAVPELDDADVVFISLGGNDIMHYVYNESSGKTIQQLMEGITETIETVEENLAAIFGAIRAANPDADIVWLVYPNYAESEKWAERMGEYAGLVASYFDDQMAGIIGWAAGIDNLILVDLFSRMSKEELDASLFDELHYNANGHKILGDELLKVLNGVRVTEGAPVLGGERFIGINCDN